MGQNDAGNWRKEAEGYIESAAVLFRKGKYPQSLHHCYLAAQHALKACVLPSPSVLETVSLVVIAEKSGKQWTTAQRELLLELTECARALTDGDPHIIAFAVTKERCVRILTLTAGLVSELR